MSVHRDPQGRVIGGTLNPTGRPKVDSELAKAARELSPLALQVWRKTMEDYLAGTGSASDAIRAASDSMARGFGKPPEHVQLDVDIDAPVSPSEWLRRTTPDELALVTDIAKRATRRARGEEVEERLHIPRGLIDDGSTLAERAQRARRMLGILERAGAIDESPTRGEGDEDEEE
ncbi:MAG: hypothetical protein Q8L14_08430 [Myxococcales bacterium]|nr:hypothetical protein [Myxococcales bacterium]